MKTFAASTCTFSIRVIKYKLTLDLIINEIHFHAYNKNESFGINNNSNIFFFNNFIQLLDFLWVIAVVHDIGVAIAPSSSNS